MDHAAIAAAGQYSQYSGVLAALAFTGLVVYLSRGDGDGDGNGNGQKPNKGIAVWHVAATTFFSLFSLAVVAFLYANLDGMATARADKPNPPYTVGALGTDLLAYGIVFALAVLTLLYSIVLMVFQYQTTEKMTRYAYWAVAVGGTVMVLRFLADAAREVLAVNCGDGNPPCKHPEETGILSAPAIWLTLALAAILAVLFTVAAHREQGAEPAGVLRLLKDRIVAPAVLVFGVTVLVVVVLSLYTSTRPPGSEPQAAFIDAEYFVSILLVALFAVMFGSVVAYRAGVRVEGLKLGKPAAWNWLKPVSRGSEHVLLMWIFLLIAVGVALAILVIGWPVSLWLLGPVGLLTIGFLWSVTRAKPAPAPAGRH